MAIGIINPKEYENKLGRLYVIEEGFTISIYHHPGKDFLIIQNSDGKDYYCIGNYQFNYLNEKFQDNKYNSLEELVEDIKLGHYDIRLEPEYNKEIFEGLINGRIKPEIGNPEHIKVVKMLQHRYFQAFILTYTDEFYDKYESIEHDYIEHELDPLPTLPLPYIDDYGDMFGINEIKVFALLEENVIEKDVGPEKYKQFIENYESWT